MFPRRKERKLFNVTEWLEKGSSADFLNQVSGFGCRSVFFLPPPSRCGGITELIGPYPPKLIAAPARIGKRSGCCSPGGAPNREAKTMGSTLALTFPEIEIAGFLR